MLASQVISRHLPSCHFKFNNEEQNIIPPVVIHATSSRNVFINNHRHSVFSGSSQSSCHSLVSPTSETSCSVSSDANNDSFTSHMSSYFLHEDKFDRQVSKHVQSMFNDIELSLFEIDHGTHRMQKECDDWRSAFPHFRVVGINVTAEHEDNGVHMYPTVNTTSPPVSHRHSQSNMAPMVHHETLVVMGEQCSGLPQQTFLTDSNACIRGAENDEEIFAQEGQLEEVFAVDVTSQHDDVKLKPQNRCSRDRSTPVMCMKNSILDTLFDELWSQVLLYLRPLMPDVYQAQSSNAKLNSKMVPCLSLVSHSPCSISRTLTSDKPATTQGCTELHGLLTVRSKALQEREKQHCTDMAIYSLQPSRRFSSVVECSQPGPNALHQQMMHHSLAVISLHHRPESGISRRDVTVNKPKHRRLDFSPDTRNLPNSLRCFDRSRSRALCSVRDDRSNSPLIEEDLMQITMVRGHRLSATVGNCPALPTSLPPLLSYSAKLPLVGNNKTSQHRPAGRAFSAAIDKSVQAVSPRDKMMMLVSNRPRTIQALYQPEVSHDSATRRSSTAFGIHNQRQNTGIRPESSLRRQTLTRSNHSRQQKGPIDLVRPEVHGIQLRRLNTISN